MGDLSITVSYANLNACTLVSEPNSTYLHSKTSMSVKEPLNSPTMGLMMLLSTLQYQTNYINPTYANAANQASKAAFILSGGQEFQDKTMSFATKKGKEIQEYLGVTDTETAIVLGAAKIARDKKLDISGPNIYFIKTHLTLGEGNGSINLGWKFK